MGNRINNVALVKATDPAAFRWLLQGAVAQKAAKARKAANQRQIELQRLARELAVLERSVRK